MKHLFFGSVALLALAAAGPTVAADMPVKASAYWAPVPVWTWTGFYVGANVGYSWGRARDDWNFFAPSELPTSACPPNTPPATLAICSSGSDSNHLNGAIGGFQAGYNWQTGPYLVGVETDIQLSGQKGGTTFTGVFLVPGDPSGTLSADHSGKIGWLGTLRGRAGITADRWLVYGTGGLAYGEVKVEGSAVVTGFTITPPPFGLPPCAGPATGTQSCPFASFSNSVTRAGWTAGAGVEGAIGDSWTVKLEYLYVDLGKVTTSFATLPGCFGSFAACLITVAGTGTVTSRITDQIVRVGINYKFDWGKAPLVTRY